MQLIQLFLPLCDNDGNSFPTQTLDLVRNELTEAFGGVTAFRSSPAEGVWRERGGELSRDEIVVFEVMTERLDRHWWQQYRTRLEQRFRQERLVIRATQIELL
ncbi:MAG TPA: hypothetical protein VNA19_15135 [Pyrinomonadaceae bacterium]|jgi:hypothetical protein|nr:hypothetical protein [Pyrinomonadaceae bacterium]